MHFVNLLLGYESHFKHKIIAYFMNFGNIGKR